MLEKPIINPRMLFVEALRNEISPGKFIRILGVAVGKRFQCSLQCSLSSYDDVVLCISLCIDDHTIILNSQQRGSWQDEQVFEDSPVTLGQQFEILIICEPNVYKIEVNGQHLCEFPHRIPYYRATHIKIEGDVSVSRISLENQPSVSSADGHLPMMSMPPPPYESPTAPPPKNVPMQAPYPLNSDPQAPYPLNSGPQAPYPLNSGPQAPYPLNSGPQAPYPLNSGPQAPYPLNSGPQTVIYTNNPGVYPQDPLLSQPVITTAALNSTPRSYQHPFWARPYYGDQKAMCIGVTVVGVIAIIFVVVFLVVFS